MLHNTLASLSDPLQKLNLSLPVKAHAFVTLGEYWHLSAFKRLNVIACIYCGSILSLALSLFPFFKLVVIYFAVPKNEENRIKTTYTLGYHNKTMEKIFVSTNSTILL